ncbi:putative membrane protein [Sphingobium faniae]|nr:putative membrane protein [Sphingobium faniae]
MLPAASNRRALPPGQRWMILLILAAVILANIAQPFPDLAPLQHGPTVALLLAAPWLLRRWPLSNSAFACIALFLLLHTLGARYIYSYVPYDDWSRALFGKDISSAFDLRRNSYDRLVHFAFGALLTCPLAEIACRHGKFTRCWSLLFAFAAIGLGSALYEIFEWLLTIVAAGGAADYYNGQQGDVWDPQKDMAAAQIGSALSLCLLSFRR